jgi:type VI secretion system secreted protein Hcp
VDWKNLSGSKKFRLLAAGAGAFVVLGGAAAAVAASLAPSTAVINACFDKKSGALRYIDPARGEVCTKNEANISWNQQGPIGPVGATGTTGRDGRDGLSGVTGASGPTGATGPQGVQGPQGVSGVAGPQGATGPQGPAGSGSGGGTVSGDSCSGANGVAYAVGSEGTGALFAKIDDIKGESQDVRHKDEIEVQSFTWGGITTTATQVGSGGGAGKSHACPVNVLKIRTDKATPLILQAAASGKHLQEATISAVKNGGGGAPFTFATYTFSDVLITSGGDSFNFVFTKVEVTYFPQKADGSADAAVTFGWDFAANAPF